MRLLIAALVLFFGLTGVASGRDVAASSEVVRLEELIAHRLGLMRDVAAWKWRANKPIEDLAREARVLDRAGVTAEAVGLDPETTRHFISVQMEAAKGVQQYWFDVWRRDGFPEETAAPDLTGILRPAIGRAGDAILQQLALARPLLDDPEQKSMLATYLFMRTEGLGVTQQIATEIAEAASQIAYGPTGGVLDRILARGVLRVGTIGDYPPFSMKDTSTGGFSGVDVDLARKLSASLGVDVVFVQTSWPALMVDYAAGKFDIGMSGVTRTLERQKVAYFSGSYRADGKAPIVRCGEEEQFDTLSEIDAPKVRLVVNPGGTNEAFARANAPSAGLRVFDDNTRIFDEIAAGRADVMMTDRIEVDYQAARYPGVLCPATAGTFTNAQKAFLLPRDEPWLHYVNAWLEQVAADGTLAASFARHLTPLPAAE